MLVWVIKYIGHLQVLKWFFLAILMILVTSSFSSHCNYKTQINPKKNSLKTQTMTDLLPGFGSLKQPVAHLGLFL